MKRLKTTILLSTVFAVTMTTFAASAIATVLTDGSENQLKTGTFLTAESEGSTTLDAAVGSIKCEASHVGGKTTNDGGEGISVNINLEFLSWSKCNTTVTVLKKGTVSVAWTGGTSGTLTSTGTELTVSYLGFHCIFATNATSLGTLTGGTPGTLDISATIPRTGGTSGAFCAASAPWTGSYKFTNPSTLKLDDEVIEETRLTDSTGNKIKTGTLLTAQSEGNIVWDESYGKLECASDISGKIVRNGSPSASATIRFDTWTFFGCLKSATLLAKGNNSIIWSSGNNGTLVSTGLVLTAVHTYGEHCIYSTNSTPLGSITGGTPATFKLEGTIPRTGGTSGVFCGAAKYLTGSFQFTSPSTMKVDP